MKKIYLLILLLIVSAILYFKLSLGGEEKKSLNIYSSRKEKFLNEMINIFSKETGITVNLLVDKAPKLIEKLKIEQENSPADILITSDVLSAEFAKKQDLLQQIRSNKDVKKLAKAFRDDENYWVGLSLRSRLIFYNTDLIKDLEIKNYEDLVDLKYQNSILVRSSSNPYNKALIAQLYLHNGKEKSETLLVNLTNNFARKPKGGDTDQLKALSKGIGKIAIANNYYYMRLLNSKDPLTLSYTKNIKPIYPNQDSYGVNVNLSTISIVKNAKNAANANKFISFMLSKRAQEFFVTHNYEQSVNFKIATSEISDYKMDISNIKNLESVADKAFDLAVKSGWK